MRAASHRLGHGLARRLLPAGESSIRRCAPPHLTPCFQFYSYIQLVGGSAAESGDGPGSYYHRGYVWHLDCCNPETNSGGSGWSILNALVGWNNTATLGSVLAYV